MTTFSTNIINFDGGKAPEFDFEKEPCRVCGAEQNYAFSIVIAVYNRQNEIAETINSIINQTFPFKGVQLILVDDGSTDSSFEVCKSFAEKHPKNIILIYKTNGGVSSARNVGMNFATGKYINFIDSDDMFSQNVLQCVFDFFQKYENKTDVVCIKTELFGAKKGDSWFNNKFKKGTRLIDLFKEPYVYLNSVSFSFFHSRIKNQLHFDEEISISEDLKVVNSALMNKWTLGVVCECSYLYRTYATPNESLSTGAKTKKDWYIKYLKRVYFWLYEKAMAQCSGFPEFLQHTLYRDLYNRFCNNTECQKTLSKEEQTEYKKLLKKAISVIDDKVIKNVDVINTDYQIYFLNQKYGKPSITHNDKTVTFCWNKKTTSISKKLCVMYDSCEIKSNHLLLEGYIIDNLAGVDFNENTIYFSLNDGTKIKPTIINSTTNNKLAYLDEYIFKRVYFELDIPLEKIRQSKIGCFVMLGNDAIPVSYSGRTEWFGVGCACKSQYFYQNGYSLYFDNFSLCVARTNLFQHRKMERVFLKELKSLKSPEANKAILLRKFYSFFKLFKFRKLWLISDRENFGDDNGEALYDYLKRKPGTNKYFVLAKNSTDWKRLKKKHFKLLDVSSRKYRLTFLLSDKVVSSHFTNRELKPIKNKFVVDILQKKKHIFLQHGITKDDVSSIYSRKAQKLDLIITSAKPEYKSMVQNPMYFCGEQRVKLTGFPRFDRLFSSQEKVVLIIPTWRRSLVGSLDHSTEEWSIADGFEKSYYYKFYHQLLSHKTLHETAKNLGYKIVYFPHTNLINSNKFFEDIEDIEIVGRKTRNYNKMFARASIMVTDYSSTAFDFCYLKKPIIYCQGDREEFFNSHTYTAGYFDYVKNGFGEVIETADQTANLIIDYMSHNCQMKNFYQKRVDQFFQFNDKQNCKRVYKEIKKL